MQKNCGTPWGFSESAFNLRDLNSNYQYKAFGIPWLGLKRGLEDEMVISSYGCVLAINDAPKDVLENIKKLDKLGMKGKYGLYESIDFTPERVQYGKIAEPVRTYMAHHQALILLSINNFFNNNILQKRFMKNPEMESLDILLQERMPETALVTKEKKEKIEKIKYTGYQSYSEKSFDKIDNRLNRYNAISNGEYTSIINECGEGYSKFNDLIINRYKETSDVGQGIIFFIKQITGNSKIWSSCYRKSEKKPESYVVNFASSEDRFIRKDDEITTLEKIVIDPNNAVEIRSIEIKNNGSIEQEFEVTSYMEPVLSEAQADYSHMAFNNLFLKYENIDGNIVVKRKGRKPEAKTIYLATNFMCTDNTDELEFEINKEKLYGGNTEIPEMIQKSLPFSNNVGLVIEPCIALRKTIKIMPGEKTVLNLIISVGENEKEVIENLEKYKNLEACERVFDLSRVKAEEEARYLGVKGKNIVDYQQMMSYLLFQNIGTVTSKMEFLEKNKLSKVKKVSQKDLWKYGISGDLPILLLKVRNVNDRYIVKDVLKAFEYLRTKNIKFDLVIMNEEENSYERYVKEMIQTEILNSQLGYLQNIRSGIFIINQTEIDDADLFDFVANLILDAKHGSLKSNLTELEELINERNVKQLTGKNKNTNDNINIETEKIEFDSNKLSFFNGFGGFSSDGKEYKFLISKDNPLPAVWCNVLANKKFGTLVTSNGGGFTWSKNSRLNRLTAWGNNSVEDIPSEIIYIQDKETQEYWSMSPKLNNKSICVIGTYGFGYARFECKNNQINHVLDIFIPENDSVKVNILHLENKKPEKRNLRLVMYLKPVLGEDELKSNGFINIKKSDNILYIQNLYSSNDISKIMYVSSSEKITSFTANKNFFIGMGNMINPHAMNVERLDNNTGIGLCSCVAVELNVEIDAFSSKDISLYFGEDETDLKIKNIVEKYSKINLCDEELRNIKKYWNNLLGSVTVNTESESMNILLNGWLSYQTIVCRMYARSAFYQSGGAFGFRDQLQDTLGIKFLSEDFMKNQIKKHCSHQFIEGDVEHWWHDETNAGIRTKFSDDLLWLPYVVSEYILFTGDYSILDEEVEYRAGELLTKEEDERYEEHLLSNEKESVYKHCIRAIEKSLCFGKNNLPKIGSGDWNDGFSTVGNKGKGESVWLGFFLYDVLIRFSKIMKKVGDKERVNKYEKIADELKKSLNTIAWDGKWYKRAFTDNEEELGSSKNEECKIDNIAQSWSVISNAGDNEKKHLAMQSMEQYLIDEDNCIIKLLDPPFEKSALEPGYIKSYLPGVRENGGQYTHAAIWAIIAECMLGFGDKAFNFFKMINPIEHSKTIELAKKYKVEPYVIAADIYGKDNLIGRGGWTWYTGSASWMYKAGIEYILGLKITNNELEIKPCIPKEWKGFSIQYKYKTSIYNIKYENNDNKEKSIYVNDNKINETKIKLQNDGQIYSIVIK